MTTTAEQLADIDHSHLHAQICGPPMPRQFSVLSMFSLSFALLATWNGFGSAIGTSLADASTAGSVWSLLIAAAMMMVVALGMAELSSAYPYAGAQYCWSFAVSTNEWAPFASYCSATISTFGWWLGLGATSNFVASMILAIVSLCDDNYTPQPFHTWLLYIVIIWSAIALNIFGSRTVPSFNRFILHFSIASLSVTIVTLLIFAFPNYASTKHVLTDTTNASGWSSGYGLLLCLLNTVYGFLGLDSGAHMCEEIPHPAVNVPKVILYPIAIGLITTLPFALTLMLVMQDMKSVLQGRSKMPLIEIYLQTTGSKLISAALLAAFTLSFFGCVSGNITSSSRQIWSASRDNCFPLSRYLGQVHDRWQMPANAACLTGLVVSLYGFLFVGSPTAFATMVSSTVILMIFSYTIPQGILLYRGRQLLPVRPFDLGVWGPFVNGVACIWAVSIAIIGCLPTSKLGDAISTNLNSAVLAGIVAYILISWILWQRQVFTGPRDLFTLTAFNSSDDTRPLYPGEEATQVSTSNWNLSDDTPEWAACHRHGQYRAILRDVEDP